MVKKIMLISAIVIAVMAILAVIVLQHPAFGGKPNADLMAKASKNSVFYDGTFRNKTEKSLMSAGSRPFLSMIRFIFSKPENLSPRFPIPVNNPDLHHLDGQTDMAVWLGHSSVFLQIEGIRFLVDPVLTSEFPVSLMMKPFNGTDKITPADIPSIDFLVITHDHWDHLDYGTCKQLSRRIGKVICPLGVGEHFRCWGFGNDRIIETDWEEVIPLGKVGEIVCLPTQHFSGRLLKRNRTLWCAYLLRTPKRQIYIAGDGGYDSRFRIVNRKYGNPDFAFMENGQYNKDWQTVHLMPDELVKAITELNPKRFMTVHNSKFALGRHSWTEPLDKISDAANTYGLNLITPKIGERIYFDDSCQTFGKWWK